MPMNDNPNPFPFPDLPDEVVAALSDFLDELYDRFQTHYFDQLRRYYAEIADPNNYVDDQSTLPLNDPPF
jgi:hypothetical protein